MKILEERIIKDGKVFAGNVLKVDSFLNHQIDVELLSQMGVELKKLFADENITKVLTIEASGIGVGCMVAQQFGCPLLFAFNYAVKKFVGAYAAAMGGVDAIVFTAGVGENFADQRMAIASGLEFMGVKMDEDANKVRGKETVISAADSKVKVLLIPTDEELMIAKDTAAIVG